jgi:DNA-binding transcriptional LysR family regulator
MGVCPKLHFGSADERMQALADGETDLAILTTAGPSATAATAKLYRERFVLITAPRRTEALRTGTDRNNVAHYSARKKREVDGDRPEATPR